eukprot:NODE_810_length_2071_cov_5.322895_g770_i0.p1 GENE.NODE_810_length_2071_cov_5.322895_g770_i0~~NODE_810_length_2071_cov_5.322895_g770_i0.p1  ORF type:complete len:677 (-),score=85.10 NODE_810_length_2071_cov_5.322895_g770_i0:40-1896(-)
MLKEFANSQLQLSCYRNLAELVRSSKLVSTVEAEVVEINKQLRALTSLVAHLSSVTFPTQAITTTFTPVVRETAQVNDIEIAIFERNLPRAVQHYVELQQIDGPLPPGWEGVDLQLFGDRLCEAILEEIHTQQSLNLVDTNLELLVQIDRSEEASAIFLHQRAALISSAVKRIKFMADLMRYTKQVSSLFFISVKLVVKHHRKLFKNAMLSAVIRWVTQQLDQFAQSLRVHVFQCDNYHHITRSLAITFTYCQQLEVNIGVPVVHEFQSRFAADLASHTDRHFQQLQTTVVLNSKRDNFVASDIALPLPLLGSKRPTTDKAAPVLSWKLTESGQALHRLIRHELRMVVPLPSATVVHAYEKGFTTLLETFMTCIHTFVKERRGTDKQTLAAVNASLFIAGQALPALITALQKIFKHTAFQSLHRLQTSVATFGEDLLTTFVSDKSAYIFGKKIADDISSEDTVAPQGFEDCTVSKGFLRLATYAASFKGELQDIFPDRTTVVLTLLVCQMAQRAANKDFWLENYSQKYNRVCKPLPLGDTLQVVTNLQFFQYAFVNLLDQEWCDRLRELESSLVAEHSAEPGFSEHEVRQVACKAVLQTLEKDSKLYDAVQNKLIRAS